MKQKISTYSTIGSPLVAIFSASFAVYTWYRSNIIAVSEKRILLLQIIVDLKSLHSNAVGNFSVLDFQVERLPTPTHVKRKGVCILDPKLYKYLKETKNKLLKSFKDFKARAQEGVKDADELYSKYTNYDVEFTREQIEKEIINVDYKIRFAKHLSEKPPEINAYFPELYDYECVPAD